MFWVVVKQIVVSVKFLIEFNEYSDTVVFKLNKNFNGVNFHVLAEAEIFVDICIHFFHTSDLSCYLFLSLFTKFLGLIETMKIAKISIQQVSIKPQ